MARFRTPTIRSALTRIVIVAALPVWLASALLLYRAQIDGRTLIERDAGATARAVMVAVDRDLASAETAALVLATSPSLLSDDLAGFHARAIAAIRAGVGNNVIVSDKSGQQVLNTLVPFGQQLPRHGNPDLLRRVFDTGEPAISDLYVGGVLRRPVVSIDVPVYRDGKIVYDLSIGLFPESLGDGLRQEKLPAAWVVSIFDSKGTIVARTHAADQFVGQKGAPALIERIAQVSEGMVETKTLEGISVSAVFSRSEVSNWAVAIGVPTAELTARLRHFLALSVAGTLVLVALGIAAAQVMARRLARPIRTLADAALAHGRGERVEISPLGLKEADDLGRALAEGARLLDERTAERDRTERKRQQDLAAKQQTEAAARTRSAYFAYLSHELRTPLTATLGFADLMASRIRATSHDAKLLRYCARIDEGGRHLMGVINEILDYARYEADQLVLEKRPLDVASELRLAVDLLEGKAEQVGVKLRLEVAPNLPPLDADPQRLRQILLNLLSNAVKFTGKGGTVTVTAARDEDTSLVIRITDTGIGIGAEDLARVLEPFAQVAGVQGHKSEGSGLGLPLAKALVELHGGSFAITSQPGVGSSVTAHLPMADGAYRQPATSVSQATARAISEIES